MISHNDAYFNGPISITKLPSVNVTAHLLYAHYYLIFDFKFLANEKQHENLAR